MKATAGAGLPATFSLLAALATLAACNSSSRPAAEAGKSAALRNMEQVAIAAHRCWFAANDPAFRNYSFANELNSFSGRPRFLLVPKGNFAGRPLLVVQAEGPAGRVSAFGPMMSEPAGARVSADIGRWSRGETACA
jgi:hypothetical protein